MPGTPLSPGSHDAVDWPAVIKFAGDDTLACIGSGEEWQRTAALPAIHYQPDDYLIDSRGCEFRLVPAAAGEILPVATGEVIDLQSFIRLLQLHAVAAGQCCVGKIGAGSVAEGIALARSLGD